LYRARWNNELDLRSLKCTMQMDNLRPASDAKKLSCHRLEENVRADLTSFRTDQLRCA
jgi:hypothetical protein